jgi:hypothetical protein
MAGLSAGEYPLTETVGTGSRLRETLRRGCSMVFLKLNARARRRKSCEGGPPVRVFISCVTILGKHSRKILSKCFWRWDNGGADRREPIPTDLRRGSNKGWRLLAPVFCIPNSVFHA